MPPVVAFPSLALGSAGGGDSTEQETMWAPRTMVRPRVRFASVSTVWLAPEPGAPPAFACFDLIFRNSSVSARTRFICWAQDVSTGVFLFRYRMAPPYLVERKHLTRHLPPIDERYPHPPVDLSPVSIIELESRAGIDGVVART